MHCGRGSAAVSRGNESELVLEKRPEKAKLVRRKSQTMTRTTYDKGSNAITM